MDETVASFPLVIVSAMARPRFLFTARVVTAPSAGVEPRVAWRLVGGNNHELGRSHTAFDDHAHCVAAVHVLQERVDELVPVLVATEGHAERGWQLLLDDEVVAVSARGYRRERECEYNLAQFLLAVPLAGVSEVVGGQPPRRELLRPSFLLPHLLPSEPEPDLVVSELPDQLNDEVAAS